VVVDLFLPDSQGIDTFERLFKAAPDIPILVLCAPQDEAISKLAVQRGAQDYLLKSHIGSYLLIKALGSMMARAANTEAQLTLNSSGDAVISIDTQGLVTYLNVVAERLTGWTIGEAIGRPLEDVLRIIDAQSRAPVPSPMVTAARQNGILELPPACILIRRDGVEAAVEDSAAPIHDRRGQVTGAVMMFHDVSTARALTLKWAHLAQHDNLTGLPNRAVFNDRLRQAITMAERQHTALAVLCLGVDGFKRINDSVSHKEGDRLLKSIASRLSECVRASDTVSRHGGDEFTILLSKVAHSQDAGICAEKLFQAMKLPFATDERELQVTVSVGIALYPRDGIAAETLLRNADSAMHEAKDRGRDNYQFYRSDLNARATERQSLEIGMRHAIQRHEFELRYQPIMNLATGAIAGVEALIRWRHPALGFVLPAQLISIAEESGLILPIGQWVLREACAQAKAWHHAGLPLLRVSVNTSAIEMRSKEFVAGVSKILTDTGFDPRRLELEFTEAFLMQDSKSTALVLRELKELGVQLALDDFGTGCSSLGNMRRFPIDAIKVDQSIVRDLATDAGAAAVVSAVINMGSSLRLRVVAEGVETREQLLFLEQHECAEAQGFYFSPPLAAEGFAELLRQRRGQRRASALQR
jgi:diguanylate cyclase (GGDEF)-like protein/PAS domain S-box-containing protein